MLLSLARAHGTTALAARYYRVGRGCKKLHPPLLPLRQLSLAGGHGTTAPTERYYRKGLQYYRSGEQYYRMPQISNTRSPSFCREDNRGKH